MPVRIIFRGLILFHFPKTGETNEGKLVACLINKREVTGKFETASTAGTTHGKHEHYHSAEIQVLADGHDPKPVRLDEDVNVDIVVPGNKHKPVSTLPSFDDHVPDLETIIGKGTTAEIRGLRERRGTKPDGLIQNVVTVDRGVARVKKVINWDEDGYPLSGERYDPTRPDGERPDGRRPGAPVLLKFMGSTVRGHMASEVVVDIDDATAINLVSKNAKHDKKNLKGPSNLNHNVPIGDIEVLVTNYEFRRDRPVAWGLDYQWLFEAVGYPAVPLPTGEFAAWSAFASTYDRESFARETSELLSGTDGRPFPYIASVDSLALLRPLTDDYNPPVCAFGKTGIHVP